MTSFWQLVHYTANRYVNLSCFFLLLPAVLENVTGLIHVHFISLFDLFRYYKGMKQDQLLSNV
jgi:hypothetical protein